MDFEGITYLVYFGKYVWSVAPEQCRIPKTETQKFCQVLQQVCGALPGQASRLPGISRIIPLDVTGE